MDLISRIKKNKDSVLKKWLRLILETYPAQESRLMQKRNRFDNPVGDTLAQESECLYQGLIAGENPRALLPSIQKIVKIRTIQDFTPSQAVVFVFLLKKALREELVNEIHNPEVVDDLLALESRIDELALHTFDTYMECRERIHKIRVNELTAERKGVLDLLKKASIVD